VYLRNHSLIGGLAVAVLAVVVSISGCGRAGQSTKREGIITMGPHITETVFALGQGSRVIAVGAFDDYPLEVIDMEKAGGYLNPDLEKITTLSPELLIVAGQQPQLAEYARVNLIEVLSVSMDSLETIGQGIEQIGAALRCERKAERLKKSIEQDLDHVRAAVKDLPRPKVLILTGRQTHDLNSLNTAGGASFISELVDIAGGENIYQDAPQAYFEASKETVVMAAPEVIIEFHCGEGLTQSQLDAYFRDWQALGTLPAVKCGRVYFITESHGLRPGPRVAEIARKLAGLLHPEVQLSI
jgi:iron complex transport system substrate-binding protein